MPGALFQWLQSTAFAKAVASSFPLTSWLSAIHVLGFTLVIGSALAADLRLLGAVLPGRPERDVTVPAGRAILLGLAVSIATGLPLFAAKAAETATNGLFQLKMLLLVTALAFQFVGPQRAALRTGPNAVPARVNGAIGLILWLGLAVAACAFILLE